MNKGLARNLLIVLLLTLTAFSAFKYVASLKEKHDLRQDLNAVQQEVAILSEEKQNLLQDLEKEKEANNKLASDNQELKQYLIASREKISKLFEEVKETQDAIEQLSFQISLAKAENKALFEETGEEERGLIEEPREERIEVCERVEAPRILKEEVGLPVRRMEQEMGEVIAKGVQKMMENFIVNIIPIGILGKRCYRYQIKGQHYPRPSIAAEIQSAGL